MGHRHGTERGLYLTVLLNGFISAAEFAAGIMTGSLALLSDAAHNVSDFFAVLIALVAKVAGRKPPTLRHTYGFARIEIFSALLNALVIVCLMALLVREALLRIADPRPPPDQFVVIGVAFFALAMNALSVFLLKDHEKEDVNTRSAFLHMLQDALASLLVIVSALFYGTGFGRFVDPVATILISVFVVRSAASILWETVMTLLEGVPRDIDIVELASSLEKEFPGASIHHLHIWQNGPGQRLLTAHVRFGGEMCLEELGAVISGMKTVLQRKWNITHATLEPELEGCGRSELVPGSDGSRGCEGR